MERLASDALAQCAVVARLAGDDRRIGSSLNHHLGCMVPVHLPLAVAEQRPGFLPIRPHVGTHDPHAVHAMLEDTPVYLGSDCL